MICYSQWTFLLGGMTDKPAWMEQGFKPAAASHAIHERRLPMLGYLNRLERCMEQRGFPVDDKLWARVVDARDAMHALTVAVHYASCKGQVGRG